MIELKTGTARQKSVAQILSYMGDIEEEEPMPRFAAYSLPLILTIRHIARPV